MNSNSCAFVDRKLRGGKVRGREEVRGTQRETKVRVQPGVQGAEGRRSGLRDGRQKL